MLEKVAARLTINAVIIALIVAALVVQTVRIEGFKFWPLSIHGLKAELADAKANLASITSPRNEQKRTSEQTVRDVVEGNPQTRVVVKTIHDAPNPEGCRTPGLDTLRNVL